MGRVFLPLLQSYGCRQAPRKPEKPARGRCREGPYATSDIVQNHFYRKARTQAAVGTATFSYVTFTIVKKQYMLTTSICPGPQTSGPARPPVLLPAARTEVRASFERVRKIRLVWGGMTLTIAQGQLCTQLSTGQPRHYWELKRNRTGKCVTFDSFLEWNSHE